MRCAANYLKTDRLLGEWMELWCTGLDSKLDTLLVDTGSRFERLEIGIGAAGTPMLRKGLLRGATRRRKTA